MGFDFLNAGSGLNVHKKLDYWIVSYLTDFSHRLKVGVELAMAELPYVLLVDLALAQKVEFTIAFSAFFLPSVQCQCKGLGCVSPDLIITCGEYDVLLFQACTVAEISSEFLCEHLNITDSFQFQPESG